jgi:hypothetical protein
MARRSALRRAHKQTAPASAPTPVAVPTEVPGRPAPPETDLLREYAVAGNRLLFQGGQLLIDNPDEIVRAYGPDVYRRMAHDPCVGSGIETLVTNALQEEVMLRPAVPEGDPLYSEAKDICDFCERAWIGQDTDGAETLERLARGAIRRGHRVAELTLRSGAGDDAGRYTLRLFKALDPRSVAFAVDQYDNVLGLVAARAGAGYLTLAGASYAEADLVAREKFVVLTLRGNSILGESLLRPVASAWAIKREIVPERVRFLKKRAAPPVIGIAAENAPDEQPLGVDGKPDPEKAPITGPEAIAERLAQIENFAAVGLPFGADVKTLDVAGSDKTFDAALDWCDQQITLGLLLAVLGSQESQNGTKAQAVVHDNKPDLVVFWLRDKISRTLRRDLFRSLVRVNWGEEKARTLTPIGSLGDTERKDWSAVATAAVPLLDFLSKLGHWEAVNDLLVSMGLPAGPDGMAMLSAAAGALQVPGMPPQSPPAPESLPPGNGGMRV